MVRLRINISYYGHVRGHIGGRRSILHTIVRGSFVRSHRLCIDSLGRQVTLLCYHRRIYERVVEPLSKTSSLARRIIIGRRR